MSNAMRAFDGLMNDIARNRERDTFDRIEQQLRKTIRDYEETAAGYMALTKSLQAALKKFDPNHPLIVDNSLLSRLSEGAVKVSERSKSKTWDDIKKFGENFQYPYAGSPVEVNTAMANRMAQLEVDNIHNYTEKHALRAAVKSFDPNHPLVRPTPDRSPLIAALRRAGLMAYSFGKSYDAVAEAAETFVYPHDFGKPKLGVLEHYQGEEAALQKRLDFIRNTQFQELHLKLKAQGQSSPK